MASFCVEKFGTKKLNEITQKEVETRVNEFVQLVKFDTTL